MNRISDLALDLGIFELNNELEVGPQLSALFSKELKQRHDRAFAFHQEAVRRAMGPVRTQWVSVEMAKRAS
jgi:hypothetical protein